MKNILLIWFPFLLFCSPTAYVSQRSSGLVGTFDTCTHRTGVNIAVEDAPQQVAISPDAQHLYVVNKGSDSISIIQTKNYEKLGTMFLDDPAGIAISPDGEKGYIVSNNALYRFDVQQQMMEKCIAKIAGYGSRKLVLAPDGKAAYITLSDAICCVDLVTGVSMNLHVEGKFEGMCLTPDGKRLCVVSTFFPFSFFSIDTETKQVVQEISLQGIAEGARAVVITHDGKTAYITGEATGNLVPIDLATGRVGKSISVGIFPKDAAITPDGATIFVANFISDNITPVDVATGQAQKPISFPDECVGITIEPVDLVQDFQGKQITSRFLSTNIYTNQIAWKKAEKATTERFRIWKNGVFFRDVMATDNLYIEDRRIRKGVKSFYSIVAISPSGTQSKPFLIEVP